MKPQTFHLERLVDVSGVSGTGIVAHGVIFDSGQVAMEWLTETSSIAVYRSMKT